MRLHSQITRLIKSGRIKAGEFQEIQIAHDDYCKTLKTNRSLDCNCHPDIYDMNGDLLK